MLVTTSTGIVAWSETSSWEKVYSKAVYSVVKNESKRIIVQSELGRNSTSLRADLVFLSNHIIEKSVKIPTRVRYAHQAKVAGGLVLLTNTGIGSLVEYNITKDTFRELVIGTQADHINSLYFEGDDILVLSHNLEIPSKLFRVFPTGEVEVTHKGFGEKCHNIFKYKGKLCTLNSRRGTIVTFDGDVVLKLHPDAFLRGVLQRDGALYVGTSSRFDKRESTVGIYKITENNTVFFDFSSLDPNLQIYDLTEE